MASKDDKDKFKDDIAFVERPALAGKWGQPGHYKWPYNVFWKGYLDCDNTETRRAALREYFRTDLFFLLYYGMQRRDVNKYNNPFIVDACREVESGPKTDTLDLWSRGSYKSTIITQGFTLQNILNEPQKSVAFFSHQRPIAKAFLAPIKYALETNPMLKFAFPDILWGNPRKATCKWTDEELELKGRGGAQTYSFEAWGLVDGMPTGKHYDIRVYDDVITEKVVNTPEMMHKVARQFQLSDNLKADDGWERVIGTSYNHGDFYQQRREEAEKGIFDWYLRVKAWWDGNYTDEEIAELGVSDKYLAFFGTRKPVLYTWQEILRRRLVQGPYNFAAQMELDPTGQDMATFQMAWIKYYRRLPPTRIKRIFVDPANEKKPDSDYTVIVVVSKDEFGNRYLEDMIRDKLNLGERFDAVADMYREHHPVACVYMEKYGKDSDEWYFNEKMKDKAIHFPLEGIGGRTSKVDRIKWLVPIFEQGKFFLPENGIWRYDRNLVQEFLDEEYRTFPFCKTYDMLDAISRHEDPQVQSTGPMVTGGQNWNVIMDQRLRHRDILGV